MKTGVLCPWVKHFTSHRPYLFNYIKKGLPTLKGANLRKLLEISRKVDSVISGIDTKNTKLWIDAGGQDSLEDQISQRERYQKSKCEKRNFKIKRRLQKSQKTQDANLPASKNTQSKKKDMGQKKS